MQILLTVFISSMIVRTVFGVDKVKLGRIIIMAGLGALTSKRNYM